ncbi:MAG TPA: DUF3891 family protein [Terriglobales bacterium]|nr:DUF3891 family protein [Terriglobales bacterium]
MVLQPIGAKPCPTLKWQPRPGALPIWVAVAERQKQCAEAWWLVAQPDHAALSGDLAANFVSPLFPRLTPEIAKAVGAHDAGWSMFPPEADPNTPPMIADDWKPRSFMEFPPQDFLRAWTGSIEGAEEICPEGGVMVSRHFCFLGQVRLKQQIDAEPEMRLVHEFLDRESRRQERLMKSADISRERSNDLLKVVQFCDVLSLYLCCGATEDVEFPTRFGGQTVKLHRTGDVYVLSPSPFQAEGPVRTVSLGVPARKHPANGTAELTTLRFFLQ